MEHLSLKLEEAINPIAVEYKLVIKPNFCGNLSLMITGNKTLQIAIPAPIKNVPINNNKTAKKMNGLLYRLIYIGVPIIRSFRLII